MLDGLKRWFTPRERGVVLALGGGGASGLAHIGVLAVLVEHGIAIRGIAGTSVGAEIGAFYAAGTTIDELTRLATDIDWKQTARLFLPDLPTGGLVSGSRIVGWLRRELGEQCIETLGLGFVAVTTDLERGEQVVIDRGDLVDAVRASISIPGFMAPHAYDGRLLIDGSVLNPVPFDVARDRFGAPVIAVAVHNGAHGGAAPPQPAGASGQRLARMRQLLEQPWMDRAQGVRDWLMAWLDSHDTARRAQPWTTRRVLDRVYGITQAEIVRLRARQSPPDLTITPMLKDIGILEFYRAREAIDAGRAAAMEALPALRDLYRRSGRRMPGHGR